MTLPPALKHDPQKFVTSCRTAGFGKCLQNATRLFIFCKVSHRYQPKSHCRRCSFALKIAAIRHQLNGCKQPAGDGRRVCRRVGTFFLIEWLQRPILCGYKLELNSSLYYAGSVSRWAALSGVRLDAGLVYRPGKNLEFSVVGQYLLDSQQGPEMTAWNTSQVVEPEHAVFARVKYKF